MKTMNKAIIRLLVTASIFFMAACGNTQSSNPAAEPTKATSANATDSAAPVVPADTLQLDPANADAAIYPTVANLYETLVKEDNGQITGVLAESFSASEDGLDYIFTLRPGVTFHDGEALNAEAVIANFNRWFDPADANHGTGAFQAWVDAFGGFKGELTETNTPKSTYDGIEKVDDLTVLVHLNTADADFLKKISGTAFSIVSPAILTATAGDGGTGPYTFGGFANSDTIKLDPFAGYWNAEAVPSESTEAPIK